MAVAYEILPKEQQLLKTNTQQKVEELLKEFCNKLTNLYGQTIEFEIKDKYNDSYYNWYPSFGISTFCLEESFDTLFRTDNVSFSIKLDGNCCGMARLHWDGLTKNLERLYIKEYLELIDKIAEICGYSTISYTNNSHTSKRYSTMLETGWKVVHSFINQRNDNNVEFMVKEIKINKELHDSKY